MDAIQINLLEEFKYVDAICRDMFSAEKGVSAYIEQMETTPETVRYRIAGWNDDFRQLKHIRWLRNQIAHSTEYVECTQADVDWLKAFHNRLLIQQDPLAKAYRYEHETRNHQPQSKNKPPTIALEVYKRDSDYSRRLPTAWIVVFIIVVLIAVVGVLVWNITMK